MWPDKRLCDLFGIEHPIIQAPMVGSDTAALTGAVSNAGGLGSVGCGLLPIETAKGAIAGVVERTNRPFNVNFMVGDAAHTSQETLDVLRDHLAAWYAKYDLGPVPEDLPEIGPMFGAKEFELVMAQRPAVVSFHFGVPEKEQIRAMRDAGIKLMCSATNVAEARALEAAGMDAIIAQGWEAGGHRGQHEARKPWDGIGGLSLIPQIVDAVCVPVVAAGGIADGRGIAAAFALGAAGVQIGTGFLGCPEAKTDPARRARIANAQDTDTMMIDSVSGRPARGLRSAYSEEMERHRVRRADYGQMYALSRPLMAAAPDDEVSFMLYGQSAGLGRDLAAGELIAAFVEEAHTVFRRLGRT